MLLDHLCQLFTARQLAAGTTISAAYDLVDGSKPHQPIDLGEGEPLAILCHLTITTPGTLSASFISSDDPTLANATTWVTAGPFDLATLAAGATRCELLVPAVKSLRVVGNGPASDQLAPQRYLGLRLDVGGGGAFKVDAWLGRTDARAVPVAPHLSGWSV